MNISYRYEPSWGTSLDCVLEHVPAYDGGTGPNSDESWPESIDLIDAVTDEGSHILDVLDPAIARRIERAALCTVRYENARSLYDARIDEVAA